MQARQTQYQRDQKREGEVTIEKDKQRASRNYGRSRDLAVHPGAANQEARVRRGNAVGSRRAMVNVQRRVLPDSGHEGAIVGVAAE